MNPIRNWTAAAIGALLLAGGAAQAATVTCPGSLGPDGGSPEINVTRQIQVTGAKAGGECYYQLGNFIGDDFSAYFGADYDLIEKDVATEGTGGIGDLYFTANADRNAGTWTMASDFWEDYDQLYIAFHFGGGGSTRDPDSFIVELQQDVLTGNWALIPTNLANGLSNIYLIGRGDGNGGGPGNGNGNGGGPGNGNGGGVPEPGSVALVGLGLAALALRRTRRRA